MARLITKFKYLKPEDRKNVGGYAEYIATREGVEKIDESKRNAPATNKQKQLIKKILSDFPDSKSSLEYEDYLKEKTVGAASEFITRALEENADEMMHTKTYADYIATRPRAERFGSHGLFTDDGVAVDLKKVSDELNAHTGNVWTAIVSLRREDAERLGYDNGSRWRDMLRSQTQTLSENLKIPMSNLRWFAAFHNESYHPHVHVIVYSTNPNEGYLSEKGVMALRSSFAKDIFAQALLCEYKKQTEHRDALKVQSREVLAELIAKINGGTYDNPQVEDMLQALAMRLAVTNGKKQYGYLRKDIKEIINSIVDELGKDERIAALYDLWYESKETALKVYTESRPKRLPLSQNKEFKSVKNMVIAEAMKLNLPTDEIEETDEPTEPDREPTVEEAESPDPPPPPMDEYERTVADADKGNKWSQYRAAKFMLDRDGDHYDPKKAVEYLTRSAKQGYTVAKYMLGKLYLRGEDVPKQMLHALHWLESAVKDDNPYAEYLLGKTFLKGEDMELLPNEHKAKWFAGAALNTAEQSMASVMSTALSRLNAFLDTELEQLLCFDTEIDAETFCNQKSAIFVIMPEEDPNTFFMISLIIQQLYREILAVADENGGKLKNRCVFFCDEFGTLPKIESAEMMFSASRSRRLQIVPIIQSFAQLEKNYGKEGEEIIVDNTQDTIFGGFAPNSSSAETLSKALGSRTVMSGSVSRSKNDPSQSLQMIERPLLTPDELKSLSKGDFIVMKTGVHPMRVHLKLFFKWGIEFDDEHPYAVPDQGNREVKYADKKEIQDGILEKYPPEWKEETPAPSDADGGGQAQHDSPKNEPQRTQPKDKDRGGNPIRTSPPKKETAPDITEAEIIKKLSETEVIPNESS